MPRPPERHPEGPQLRRLLALVRPHARALTAATAITLVQSGITLAAPKVAGTVVDSAIERSLGRLDQVVLLLLALFALRGIMSYVQQYLLRATGAQVLRRLRDRLFSHLVLLAPDFYQNRRVGELLSRLGSDMTRVQSTLTDSIPSGVRAAVTFIGTLILVFTLHTELSLVALLILAPIPAIAWGYGRYLQRLSLEVQDSLADTSAVAEEALSGIRTVQAYGQERRETDRYRGGLAGLLGLQLRSARAVGAFVGILEFIGYGAFALVLWYGGRLIAADQLSAGDLTAFLLYMFAIAGSVATIGSLYAGLRELRGASARVFEILDTTPSIRDAADARPLLHPRGALALRQVRFRYAGVEPTADDPRWALDGIELDIEPGQMVALVGPSGAGKSTLFSLILRFHDPSGGAVLLDGDDLRTLSVDSVRGAIAVVPQEIFLFSGTVADNIRYGVAGATDDDVRAAAVAAGADGFISELPAGYAEVVGERGVKLSAGQRQRIAIARAFLRQPAILLLDEATSALDADSEHVVQQALSELMRGRTTLIIAHRLATVRRADRIVMMEGGRIADTGTHAELHARDPRYRRYWELQSLS